MAIKGDLDTKDAAICAELQLSKLTPLEDITSKKMFGGHGIFHQGKLFGLIDTKGKYFLRENEVKVDFIARDGVQHSRMQYNSINHVIIEDFETLLIRTRKAIE